MKRPEGKLIFNGLHSKMNGELLFRCCQSNIVLKRFDIDYVAELKLYKQEPFLIKIS
jgi:hypothetical protein